jgi:hypothetical protein
LGYRRFGRSGGNDHVRLPLNSDRQPFPGGIRDGLVLLGTAIAKSVRLEVERNHETENDWQFRREELAG